MRSRFTLLLCKYLWLPIIMLVATQNTFGQLNLSSAPGTDTAFIDFSAATMTPALGAGVFKGYGIMAPPLTTGWLNNNAWSVNGGAYGSPTPFVGKNQTAVSVINGGLYAYTGAPGSNTNPSLMIQPVSTGNSNNISTLDLKIKNNDVSKVLTKLDLSYDLFYRNDEARSTYFNLSYSSDGINWINSPIVVDFATPFPGVAGAPWLRVPGSPLSTDPSRKLTITGLSASPGGFVYIRWNVFDNNAQETSGQRDEVGLDNINLKAHYSAPCTGPSITASSISFPNTLPQQMDVQFTRGNGAGVLVVASTSPTLSQNPVNTAIYSANNNYGVGNAIGNGFVVYNGTAAPTVIFTLFGLTPSTTYYFYIFEYFTPTTPCYATSPYLGNEKTAAPVGVTNYFRSKKSGKWNDITTWETSTDSITWTAPTGTPTSLAHSVTIRSMDTVKLFNNESGKNIYIKNKGVLDNGGSTSNAGFTLTTFGNLVSFVIENGGKFIVYGRLPLFDGTATAEVQKGGMIEIKGSTSGGSDDIAFENSLFNFRDSSIFNWNTAFGFTSGGARYFKEASAEIPIFRVSSNTNVGAIADTKIFGLFEVVADVTWNNAGKKYFRNGIIGTGIMNQDGSCGTFIINGIGVLGGSGIINLDASLGLGGMEIKDELPTAIAAKTTLISNKTINASGPATFKVTGKFFTDNFVLKGSSEFNLPAKGTLGMGSADGITTGAAGNIQTSSTRNFDIGAYYIYNGTTDQNTGNALPATIQRLTVAAANKNVTLTNSDLTIKGSVPVIYFYSSDFHIPGKNVTIEGTFVSDVTASGWLVGDENTILTLSGSLEQKPLIKDKSSLGKLIFKKSISLAVVTLNYDLNIYTGIEFGNTSSDNAAVVNFNSKNIVLKSTATKTAYFGRLYNNNVSNLTNFTVERYIPSDAAHGKSWQLLSVPLASSTQTINAAWQEGATFPNQDLKPGYGTMITGNVANAASPAIGFDAYTPVASTIKTYDPLTNNWESTVTNTKSTNIALNKPYLLLVRGDRSVITYNAPSIPTTLRTTGKLYYGSSAANKAPSVFITPNKFGAISNPYASAIDWTDIFRSEVKDVYYVWDPLLNGSYGLGGFQTIAAVNGYRPSSTTANYNVNIPVTSIQSGQGFMIESDPGASNPGIVFSETNKITTSATSFRPAASPINSLIATLYTGTGIVADGAVVVYDTKYSNSYDKNDATKIKNEGENLGIISNGQLLAVEARNSLTDKDTIQLMLSNFKAITYKLKFKTENLNVPLRAYLNDRFLGSSQEISLSDSSDINFMVSADAGSKVATRFYITFRKKERGNITPPVSSQLNDVYQRENIVIYPNPVSGKFFTVELNDIEQGDYKISFLGSSGKLYFNRQIKISQSTQQEKFELPSSVLPGIYQLFIEGKNFKNNMRVIVN